jgi:hypothetical protein
MVKKGNMPKLQTTKFLQQRPLTQAQALDRRQQVAVECTETGQLWQTAHDGVKEIHIETVAQFVAAAESLDLQRNGKWGRCACLTDSAFALHSVRTHAPSRSGYVFRGLPNHKWELLTSLMRSGKSPNHSRFVELPILRSFQRRDPHPCCRRCCAIKCDA